MTRSMTIAATVAFATLVAASAADAQSRRYRDGGYGGVETCSRYGNGCTRGAVRQGPVGPQVRMPGGTWINCRGDCREALREETIDFWETLRERQPSGSFGR